MQIFLIIPFFAGLIGGVLGWFAKCGLLALAGRCAVVTMFFGIAVSFIIGDPPESLSGRYLLASVGYYIFPYLIFLLAPNLLGAVVVYVAKRKYGAK